MNQDDSRSPLNILLFLILAALVTLGLYINPPVEKAQAHQARNPMVSMETK